MASLFQSVIEFLTSILGKQDKPAATEVQVPQGENILQPQNDIKVDDKSIVLKLNIPNKLESAVTGSTFVSSIMNLAGAKREQAVLDEFLKGNVPDFLRTLVPVNVTDGINNLIYYAMPNFLTIGTNEDYFICPMTPITAQKIANAYGATLPTSKMVDQIYSAAEIKPEAIPHGPPFNQEMESTQRFQWSNAQIVQQLSGKDLNKLCEGHKKNVCLDNGLIGKQNVCIYGWFKSGAVIQGVNCVSHSATYADYSHGCRMISQSVILNGEVKSIFDIFKDQQLSKLINKDGMLKFNKYNV